MHADQCRYRTHVQPLRSSTLWLRLSCLPNANHTARHSTYKCVQHGNHDIWDNPTHDTIALILSCYVHVSLDVTVRIVVKILERVKHRLEHGQHCSYLGFDVGSRATKHCSGCCETCWCRGSCGWWIACWAGTGLKMRGRGVMMYVLIA